MSFLKSLEERIVCLSSEVVADCETMISQLEYELQTCNTRYNTVSTRVASVESLLFSMNT
jgi:hypothetical protein